MFRKDVTIESLNQMNRGNLLEHLGIEFTEATPDSLTARMPVDHRTRQPMGLLHGGASVALAESLGSVASYLCVDAQKHACVGLEINANHVRGVRAGFVYGKVTPLHVGKRTHVWEIRVTNEDQQLVCVSRLTVAVIDQK
ncbi:MAG: hotdog fold thioesterase [Tunicatimonas sp.]